MIHRLASGGRGLCSQVLCVSHLPQVAIFADNHVKVEKKADGEGRVVTNFRVLRQEDERLAEVGEMLGLGAEAAKELLVTARATKAV